MSQSALTVGLLLFMFVVFVAARGRLNAYTDVLWGGGGKGGGTKGKKSVADKEGDGIDKGDAARLISAVLPYPFDIPFDLFESSQDI